MMLGFFVVNFFGDAHDRIRVLDVDEVRIELIVVERLSGSEAGANPLRRVIDADEGEEAVERRRQ